MLARVICVLLGFLAGFAVARLAREASLEDIAPVVGVADVGPGAATVPENTPPPVAVADADMETPGPASGLPPLEGLDRLQFLRVLAQLNRERVLHISLSAFSHEHRLNESAKLLYAITDDEAERIQAIMDKVRAAAVEVEIASAKVVREKGGDKVVFDIPSFPERGGRLFDDLSGGMKEVLGDERGALLVESGNVANLFSEFGVGVREITVEKIRDADGRVSFKIEDKQRGTPHENSDGEIQYQSSSTNMQNSNDRAGVVRVLGPLAEKLLPEDF